MFYQKHKHVFQVHKKFRQQKTCAVVGGKRINRSACVFSW
jgi:hypothetical protein